MTIIIQQTFLHRLKTEHRVLQIKLEKLNEFLGKTDDEILNIVKDAEEVEDLRKQSIVMTEYEKILSRRVARHNGGKGPRLITE